MSVIRSVTSAICHRKNHPRADRPSKLDRLFDLVVSRPQLLCTCEVSYRSRLAMQGEHKSQVHQLLGLGVQCACGMRLLEVVGVALLRVEVASPKLKHFPPRKLRPDGTMTASNRFVNAVIPEPRQQIRSAVTDPLGAREAS